MNSQGSQFDVLTVGHPLVDVITRASDEWIETEGLHKGARRLVSSDQATDLYARMGPGEETSGGCAASTAAGVVACGASAAFMGTVGTDQLGDIFVHDIRASGVTSFVERVEAPPTGRCLILVTPDGERTMNTCIGAGTHTSLDSVWRPGGPTAKVVYAEAYLMDNGHDLAVWDDAADRIHTGGGRLALSLSDHFCVERHRDALLGLFSRRKVDVCIGNEHEVRALFGLDSMDDAGRLLADSCEIVAVTMGERGARVHGNGHVLDHRAEAVEVSDTTGAGDLYSAGFLAGLAMGYDLDRAGRLAIRCAGEVVTRVGARLPVGLKVTVS